MVPTVPITPTRLLLVTRTAARAPGSITPTSGTSCSNRNRSRAAAEAVLQATTTILTSCSSINLAVISRANSRTSSSGRGPYGYRPVSPTYTRSSAGSRSMSARATVSPPKPLSNMPIGRSSPFAVTGSEVDDGFRPGFDLVEVGRPGAGAEVLPTAVADDGDEDPLVDLGCAANGGGHDGARRDAGEHADLGEPPGPLDRLSGPHDEAAVEQVVAVVVDEHRGHEPFVDVLEAVDHLARRWLDGPQLHVGVLLLEEPPDAHERPGGAEPGDEVGDLGAVAPDLGAGAFVVGLRVRGVAVLEREEPVGVLEGH